MRKLLPCIALLLCSFTIAAQKKSSYKFEKITAADLEKKVYSIDSHAHAVYIADVGTTEFNGNTKGWFTMEYKRKARIHILNKNAYSLGDVYIGLYTDGNATEKLGNVKGISYNLENGKVVETKLDKDNIFTEKRNKNYTLKKFTIPNIKEGSIIEFEYTIESDFLRNLQSWTFQGMYPRLWTEYTLALPQFFHYAFLSQGFQNFHTEQKNERNVIFTVVDGVTAGASDKASFNAVVTDYKWAMKDVPALKEENFTSTVENHIAKIEFQLAAYRDPLTYRNIMGTWPDLTKYLLESEHFGRNLNTANNWLDDLMRPLVLGATTEAEKAKRIYAFVRDNFTCTSRNGVYASQSLKNVLKDKTGSVSEINLLLTAMLRWAQISAEPVMLSRKSEGYTFVHYPMLSRFNYVVTRATVDGETMFLDASYPKLGFGRLLPECYNGHSRIVNSGADAIDLIADSLKEKKVTSLYLTATDKGEWVGNVKQGLGYYESYRVRQNILKSGKEEFFKAIRKDFGAEVTIEDGRIDSLQMLEEPVTVAYNFKLDMSNEDIIYLTPMFGEAYKENPFKSADRRYPVEMPYTFDETYLATITIPEGYEIDEMPKSVKVNFNEQKEGLFEFIISKSGSTISMRSRVTLKKAYFEPEEYEILREFFNMVVNKQKEQIVLKKKK